MLSILILPNTLYLITSITFLHTNSIPHILRLKKFLRFYQALKGRLILVFFIRLSWKTLIIWHCFCKAFWRCSVCRRRRQDTPRSPVGVRASHSYSAIRWGPSFTWSFHQIKSIIWFKIFSDTQNLLTRTIRIYSYFLSYDLWKNQTAICFNLRTSQFWPKEARLVASAIRIISRLLTRL